MSAASRADLDAIYANDPDPWSFRTSPYEQERFERTLEALSRPHYRALLEIGCGNGELARRLSTRTARYVGLDAAPRALEEARRAVPNGEFVEAYLPGPLPDAPFEAVVLSEVLYFLDRDGIAWLAHEVGRRWPAAEILAVNYLQCSPKSLNGDEAVDAFAVALGEEFSRDALTVTERYRIDRFLAKPTEPVKPAEAA